MFTVSAAGAATFEIRIAGVGGCALGAGVRTVGWVAGASWPRQAATYPSRIGATDPPPGGGIAVQHRDRGKMTQPCL